MFDIVKIALHRPLTFIVMAILIAIFGVISAVRAPIDMFPEIRIPVIAVAWGYSGLNPQDMTDRIVTPYERALTTTVNNIEHIESQSMVGIGIVKIYFQPGTNIATANAQVTAISQTLLRQLPPGTTPPLILNYNASTVPILQLALSGAGMSEQQLFDMGQNQIRPQLVTIPGLAMPFPSGGKMRQVQVDLDPSALQSKGLSAQDVSDAIAAQNQINPAGFVKIGPTQYSVRLNNAPTSIEALNDLPVKVVNGATITMRDVAHVRDGAPPQTNVVHVNARRSVLLTVLKNGATSTLSIIDGVKTRLPKVVVGLPDSLKVLVVGDQSVFVRAAVSGVVREGLIAAGLTSLMILLFLGSVRSTLIIVTSIPLAVLAAIATLYVFGETLNVMTLGGLALAVGLLVDEATVTIENINWHLEQGKGVIESITDGAAQIVVPAFVSMLCICIVFVPMFFLPGVAGYLFVPMALAVVFSMMASFILSRTLVPTMAMYLLKPHEPHAVHTGISAFFVGIQRGFEGHFERLRAGYIGLLRLALAGRQRFVIGFLLAMVASFGLLPFLGSNFFPSVDSGQILMHVRVPMGSRIEETSARFDRIGLAIREIIPPAELTSITDNIGLPVSAINVTYNNSGTIGSQDGDIMITMGEGHEPTAGVIARLRRELPRRFPGTTFAFLPADITSQILNFGSPAPIDVQVSARDPKAARAFAEKILAAIGSVPGIADTRIQQPQSSPEFNIDVNRSRIGQYGVTERDVTNSLANALAGTSQVAPVYFVNPNNGVQYPVVAQAPEYLVDSVNSLANVPVSGQAGSASQLLGGVAQIRRTATPAVISHYNIQPVFDVYATTSGRDLGGVAGDINKVLAKLTKDQPKGVTVTIRGQYETMNTAFIGLGLGIIGAIALIYLLIVVNFQSWLDPLVIISALPAALAGIIWMLFVSGTTLSVPALTGAIMCMGIATANSILVISFARERLVATGDATMAAIEAGIVRFRPVLMTALAMVIGMVPMALGLGEGGEQNAPLGRAVIGGLLFATVATLMFVPVVFSIAHRRRVGNQPSLEPVPSHV
ncbi:acriflavin resistance protein [Novosphingobium nitrogenifigens DSM 19370]|uniref:Acriflavin resistance protein n=1 Tax=Novosphingobium nitrogenifigens DSM 19370 TaxID=983920 RepID=F1ZD21_9SPHN|nr:efflux RND transporter permease subunit [Novosphingobium nitrogenifigens]EGD57492.1 acriflavin resistance protein [Novosphingobium nitrogenifigens DSM 19370]